MKPSPSPAFAAARPSLLHATSAGPLASAAAALADLKAWQVHDLFNLATLPVAIALVGLAFSRAGYRKPLALFMGIYMAIDALWILLRPDVVRAPGVLLAHHAATVLLVGHTLVHPAHLSWVASFAVVEINTWLLIARRHVGRASARVRAILAVAFYATWIGIRVLWFPFVALKVWCCSSPWPSGLYGRVAYVGIGVTATALTVLQCVWSRDVLKMMGRELREHLSRQEQRTTSSGFL